MIPTPVPTTHASEPEPTSRSFPTNRRETRNVLSIEPPLLVDTMGISFAVMRAGVDVVAAPAGFRTKSTRRLPCGLTIGLSGSGFAWIEGSVAKVMYGHNIDGVPLPDGLEVLRHAYGEALDLVEPDATRYGDRFEMSRVHRVDPVRDFDSVLHVDRLLDGLAVVPRDRRWIVGRHIDPKLGRAQTLRVGPRSGWQAVLYDKHQESLARGLRAHLLDRAAGRLRFEARLRGGILGSSHASRLGGRIVRVEHLDEVVVAGLRRSVFDRVGFGLEVCGPTRLAQVLAGAGLSAREVRELAAYLVMPAIGLNPGFSAPTARKYARMASDLGITPLQSPSKLEVSSVRLDFDAGRVVRRSESVGQGSAS
jgi:hypothetical protein